MVFRFAQSETVQFRTGLGFNWLEDDGHTDAGFNFTYGVDIYPSRPWVFSTTLDLGALGHSGLVHSRTTVGFQWKRLEVFTGYDFFKVGSAEIDGLISGLQIWF
ncbi:MAG: hypothetical protein CMJ78_17165 [Planctomycetaceae bacterium]|nr:hypothetical protein [Planctomycetaceae bacterium]